MAGNRGWLTWITNRDRRETVSLVVGGVLVVAGAAWGAYRYFNKPDAPAEVTYHLCVGPTDGGCPKNLKFVRGDQETISEWTKNECAKYKRRDLQIKSGPASDCNCFIVDIKCSSG